MLIGAMVVSALIVLIQIINLLTISLFVDLQQYADRIELIGTTSKIPLQLSILGLQALISSFALVGLYLFFRKTPSPEVFFFQFALLTWSFTSLRSVSILLATQVVSLFSLLPLTKLVVFGRISALFCLFLSGYFATGVTFQRQGFYLFGGLGLAAIIAGIIPVDCTVFQMDLLCNTGKDVGFKITFYSIGLFAVGNYLYAAAMNSNRDYIFNSAAVFLVLAGTELSYFYISSTLGLLGLGVVVAGVILFAQKTHKIYQWF